MRRPFGPTKCCNHALVPVKSGLKYERVWPHETSSFRSKLHERCKRPFRLTRYRTLPREALWEKAVARAQCCLNSADVPIQLPKWGFADKVGSTTPLQRKEKRLGRPGLRTNASNACACELSGARQEKAYPWSMHNMRCIACLGPAAAYTLTRSRWLSLLAISITEQSVLSRAARTGQSQSSKNRSGALCTAWDKVLVKSVRTNSPEWLPDYDPDGAARHYRIAVASFRAWKSRPGRSGCKRGRGKTRRRLTPSPIMGEAGQEGEAGHRMNSHVNSKGMT